MQNLSLTVTFVTMFLALTISTMLMISRQLTVSTDAIVYADICISDTVNTLAATYPKWCTGSLTYMFCNQIAEVMLPLHLPSDNPPDVNPNDIECLLSCVALRVHTRG